MTTTFIEHQSAPECQLHKVGTPGSFGILRKAAKGLSNEELHDLDEDLTFYAETGLIGVQMSRLLMLLRQNVASKAA